MHLQRRRAYALRSAERNRGMDRPFRLTHSALMLVYADWSSSVTLSFETSSTLTSEPERERFEMSAAAGGMELADGEAEDSAAIAGEGADWGADRRDMAQIGSKRLVAIRPARAVPVTVTSCDTPTLCPGGLCFLCHALVQRHPCGPGWPRGHSL